MKSLTNRPAALAVAAGAAIALAVPLGSAVAADSPPVSGLAVEVVSGELVAKGVAADITLEYTCAPGGYSSLNVQLAQRSGPEVTSGQSSFVPVTCDGTLRTTVVRITATTGARAFKAGTALVTANLSGCSFTCGTASDSEELSLRR